MDDSIHAFENVIQLVLDADISLQNFKDIQQHKQTVLQMCEISRFQPIIDDVDASFERRGKELAKYLSFLSEFGGLWQSCQEFFPGYYCKLSAKTLSVAHSH